MVDGRTAGRRLDWAARRVLQVSAGQLRRLKFSQGLLIDGQIVRSDHRLSEGELLTLRFAQEAASPAGRRPGPLTIAFEDEALLALVKPAPLPAMRSIRQAGPTLQHWVEDYLGAPGYVYRPVNRLDKGTSGLMLVAKSAHVQQLMQRQLFKGSMERGYLAVTMGRPPEDGGLIDLPIGQENSIRRRVDPAGRPSRTRYELLRAGGGRALLRLGLLTGRTHQIRVHLAALGCPVLGDFLYGRTDPALPGRFALHASLLAFDHPFTGRRLTLESPLPPELQALAPENAEGRPIREGYGRIGQNRLDK